MLPLLQAQSEVLPGYRWLKAFFRLFFITGTDKKHQTIADLQARAGWISIAFLGQAILVLNDMHGELHIPLLLPFGEYTSILLLIGSLLACAMALRPPRAKQAGQATRPLWWQTLFLVLTLLVACMGAFFCYRTIVTCFSTPTFSNDGASIDTNAAINLLQGHDPYTSSHLQDIAARFHIKPYWTTPLMRGQFAHNHLTYPTTRQVASIFYHDLKTGQSTEFETNVSYPALSFLSLEPLVFLHDDNIIILYLFCYIALLMLAYRYAMPQLRPWVIVLWLANVPMWGSIIGSNLDILYILLIVLSWYTRAFRWRSALFLGLALATKQLAWFFIPFYIIMLWQQVSLKEALYRMTIAGGLALAINLPFMLWNPQAWLAGVLAPLADPMFPLGVGLVNLSQIHALPGYLPQSLYSGLEAGAMLICMGIYWRICKGYPEAALLLAILPLFFAWRSLASYFYCIAYPLFVLMVIRPLAQQKTTPTDTIEDEIMSDKMKKSEKEETYALSLTKTFVFVTQECFISL